MKSNVACDTLQTQFRFFYEFRNKNEIPCMPYIKHMYMSMKGFKKNKNASKYPKKFQN